MTKPAEITLRAIKTLLQTLAATITTDAFTGSLTDWEIAAITAGAAAASAAWNGITLPGDNPPPQEGSHV